MFKKYKIHFYASLRRCNKKRLISYSREVNKSGKSLNLQLPEQLMEKCLPQSGPHQQNNTRNNSDGNNTFILSFK